MIITRYLIKEIFSTLVGVLLVLFLIAVSAQLVGLLGKVASGVLHVNTVLIVMGLNMFTLVAFILPLALYLAILLVLSRLYRDSEMTAIAACGVGPVSILRAVLVVGVVFALVQGVFTLQLAPWAEGHIERFKEQSKKSTDIEGVFPGRFNELSGGAGVVYVQSISDDGSEMQTVFLQKQDQPLNDELAPRQSLMVARSAYQYNDQKTGDRFLMLENGYRYEGRPGEENFTVIEFQKHAVRLREKSVTVTERRHRAIPTRELLGSEHSGHQAELQWRLSSALLCIVLPMLAAPLSRTSQRQGRYGKLAVAIILYMVFTNLLNVARTWLHNGKIQPELGLWWVHGIVILVALGLLLQQTGVKHWFKSNGTRAAG